MAKESVDARIADLSLDLNEKLTEENKKLKKENRDLCKYYTKNQMLKDDMIGLVAENTRLRKTLEFTKTNSYPGLAVKESTLLNRIYRHVTKTLTQKGGNNDGP